jgi:hypothetical protein
MHFTKTGGRHLRKEANMELSDDQIVNIWGREPRYHAAPIGSTDIAFARAVEAEVRKQDDALILMLVERLERADTISGHANNKAAIKAARARLEGKP